MKASLVETNRASLKKVSPKPALLFICHRIPYPPDKGDKIRSYHFLRGLSENYRVFLGAFVDEEKDWQYASALEQLCEEVCLISLTRGKKITRALMGLIKGNSLTTSCYHDNEMYRWARGVKTEHNITRILAFSGGVGPIAQDIGGREMHRAIDLVDVDSEKWRQYASNRLWPKDLIFRREAKLLLHEERKMSANADAVMFVSKEEAELFSEIAPEFANKVTHVKNGVDTNYFTPSSSFTNPYNDRNKNLVFTGAMGYWPNVEAVLFFDKEVMPRLLKLDPLWRFHIVGSNPSREVLSLGNGTSTHVVGAVDDIRPWLNHASLAVAPMLVSRGVQNKVLEAMAMGLRVIASHGALEGIGAGAEDGVMIASTPDEYVEAITTAISKPVQGYSSREFVMQHFSWDLSTSSLSSIIENCKRE